jgi:DNA-binding NtrC family response regulator
VFSDSVPRIFVVDDEPVVASTIAAILQLHGYCANSFTSPLEALTAARSRAPDMLISDVAMPGVSGIDLAIQMRTQFPTCRILLLSGHAAVLDLVEDAQFKENRFAFLQKPIPPAQLVFEVGKIINGKVAIRTVLADWASGMARLPLDPQET